MKFKSLLVRTFTAAAMLAGSLIVPAQAQNQTTSSLEQIIKTRIQDYRRLAADDQKALSNLAANSPHRPNYFYAIKAAAEIAGTIEKKYQGCGNFAQAEKSLCIERLAQAAQNLKLEGVLGVKGIQSEQDYLQFMRGVQTSLSLPLEPVADPSQTINETLERYHLFGRSQLGKFMRIANKGARVGDSYARQTGDEFWFTAVAAADWRDLVSQRNKECRELPSPQNGQCLAHLAAHAARAPNPDQVFTAVQSQQSVQYAKAYAFPHYDAATRTALQKQYDENMRSAKDIEQMIEYAHYARLGFDSSTKDLAGEHIFILNWVTNNLIAWQYNCGNLSAPAQQNCLSTLRTSISSHKAQFYRAIEMQKPKDDQGTQDMHKFVAETGKAMMSFGFAPITLRR